MSFFYAPEIQSLGSVLTLSREESQHLAKTLRAKEGDSIKLLNGLGETAEAIITRIERKTVTCKITTRTGNPEPEKKIHLYLAPPRNSILTSLIKQCVELGVWEITLVDCDFSVSKPANKGLYINEIIAAAKQSGNIWFPKVNALQAFTKAFNSCSLPMYYGAVPVEKSSNCKKITADNISLWIGPEGGFSPQELTTLQSKAQGIVIGNWILRVETACTGLLSVVNNLMEN